MADSVSELNSCCASTLNDVDFLWPRFHLIACIYPIAIIFFFSLFLSNEKWFIFGVMNFDWRIFWIFNSCHKCININSNVLVWLIHMNWFTTSVKKKKKIVHNKTRIEFKQQQQKKKQLFCMCYNFASVL